MFAEPVVLMDYMRTWFATHPNDEGEIETYAEEKLTRFLGYYFCSETAFETLNRSLAEQWRGTQMDINAVRKDALHLWNHRH